MPSPPEQARRALAALATHLPAANHADAGLAAVEPAVARRLRRAVEFLDAAARAPGPGAAEPLLMNALLQLMRAVGDGEGGPGQDDPPVLAAARRALAVLRELPAGPGRGTAGPERGPARAGRPPGPPDPGLTGGVLRGPPGAPDPGPTGGPPAPPPAPPRGMALPRTQPLPLVPLGPAPALAVPAAGAPAPPLVGPAPLAGPPVPNPPAIWTPPIPPAPPPIVPVPPSPPASPEAPAAWAPAAPAATAPAEPAVTAPAAPAVTAPAASSGVARPKTDKGDRARAGLDARLRRLQARRQSLQSDPLAPFSALAAVDAAIASALRAAGWLDAAGVAAGAGGVSFAPWFTPDRQGLAVRAASSAGEGPVARLWAARAALVAGGAGGAALGLLAALLSEADDEVAAEAALLLAALPPFRAAVDPMLASLAASAASVAVQAPASASSARTDAFLAATARLGVPGALDELHRRVAAGASAPPLLHALAVAGGPREAALLAAVAARGGPTQALAALACGHLGHAPAVLALPATLDERVRARALHLTFGDGPTGDSAGAQTGRLLRGQPWTVAGALAQAADPGEPPLTRALRAWELASRLGRGMPLPYEPDAPAWWQERALAGLRTIAVGEPGRPGQWIFVPRAFA
jgi:hypothetical protein